MGFLETSFYSLVILLRRLELLAEAGVSPVARRWMRLKLRSTVIIGEH